MSVIYALVAAIAILLPSAAAAQQARSTPDAPARPPVDENAPPKTCSDHLRQINRWIESNPVAEANQHRRDIILRMRDRASSACAQGSIGLSMDRIAEVRSMLGMPPVAPQPTETSDLPPPPQAPPGRPGRYPVD